MPNLLSYEDQSPYSLSAQICLITFAVIFVSLRVFVKVKLVRLWGYEDYAILFALVQSPISLMSILSLLRLADLLYQLCSIVAAVLFFIGKVKNVLDRTGQISNGFAEERISDGNYNLVSALITTDIPTRLKVCIVAVLTSSEFCL